LDEKDIIKGIIEGESRTFTALVDQYQVPVFNTCLGIVQNHHDAEDIAQEVFIGIFRSIRGFRSDSKLSTWIYRIAVNKSINFVRKQKRQKWLTPLGDFFTGKSEPEFHSASSAPYSSEIEKQQRMQHLHAAIDALPENQRIAFTLNKYDELSYLEISEIMNLSVSSVESLIHRAKVNLQKKLWSSYKKETI
jgi:RNA polymerase sigma-70 factor, ECF subfamily